MGSWADKLTGIPLFEASKGCLMFPIPFPESAKIIKWVQDNVPLDAVASGGIERETHVTILFGFDSSVTEADVRREVDSFMRSTGRETLALRLGPISLFKGDEHDVLKLGLITDEGVEELNDWLLHGDLENKIEQTFPFNGHLTLCYCKPGSVDNLVGVGKFEGDVYVTDHLIYSFPESSRKVEIQLGEGKPRLDPSPASPTVEALIGD